MSDQAQYLRQLVEQSLTPLRPAVALTTRARARLVVVTSGKGGVGATTMAVNLSCALALQGWRTVLIDADHRGGDIATLCRLEPRRTVADVCAGACDVREAIIAGPAGVQTVCGGWGWDNATDWSPAAQDRLLDGLDQLRGDADVVLMDAGSGWDRLMTRFWTAADEVALVATPDPVAIMDAYAAIKVLHDRRGARIHTLINMAADEAVAENVHNRLAQASRRFLGVPVAMLGHAPLDPLVALSAAKGKPLVTETTRSPAAAPLFNMASNLARALKLERRVEVASA